MDAAERRGRLRTAAEERQGGGGHEGPGARQRRGDVTQGEAWGCGGGDEKPMKSLGKPYKNPMKSL